MFNRRNFLRAVGIGGAGAVLGGGVARATSAVSPRAATQPERRVGDKFPENVVDIRKLAAAVRDVVKNGVGYQTDNDLPEVLRQIPVNAFFGENFTAALALEKRWLGPFCRPDQSDVTMPGWELDMMTYVSADSFPLSNILAINMNHYAMEYSSQSCPKRTDRQVVGRYLTTARYVIDLDVPEWKGRQRLACVRTFGPLIRDLAYKLRILDADIISVDLPFWHLDRGTHVGPQCWALWLTQSVILKPEASNPVQHID